MILLYKCDPRKNKTCSKRSCQIHCRSTQYSEYAELDGNGKPIISYLRQEGQAPEIDIFHHKTRGEKENGFNR